MLLLCFTNLLRDHLKNKPISGVDFFSFHKFVESCCRQTNIEYCIPERPEDRSEFFIERSPQLLEESMQRGNIEYDALIVDEGQDFDEHWWIPLIDILKREDDFFFIFFSEEQQLFQRNYTLPIETQEYQLSINKRNSYQIALWLQDHFDQSAKADPLAPYGKEPQIHQFIDENDQARKSKFREII